MRRRAHFCPTQIKTAPGFFPERLSHPSSSSTCIRFALVEARQGLLLAREDPERFIELRHLQQPLDPFRSVDEYRRCALVRESAEADYQLADAGTLDVIDVPEIDDHLVRSVLENVLDRVDGDFSAPAKPDQAFNVDDRHGFAAFGVDILFFDDHGGVLLWQRRYNNNRI